MSGFNNGRVGAYELGNGEQVWEVAIANPTGRSELERLVDVGSGLQVVGNEAYVAGYHGRAVGIDVATGVVLWQQELSSYSGLGADFANVYVTSDVDAVIALDKDAGTQVWRQEALRLRDVTAPTRSGNAHRRRRLRRLSALARRDGRPFPRARARGPQSDLRRAAHDRRERLRAR